MAKVAPDFTDLLTRFERMSRKDQQAVLDHFDAEERTTFEAAIDAERQTREEERQRQRVSDRQFLGYSPQLAAIIERAVSGNAEGLTPAAMQALAAEHRTSIEAQAQQDRPAWQSVADWFQGVLSGKDRRSA